MPGVHSLNNSVQGPKRPPAVRLDLKSQITPRPATLGETPAIANPALAGDASTIDSGRVFSPQGLPALAAMGQLPSPQDYQKAVGRLENVVKIDVDLQDTRVKRKLYLRPNYQPLLKTQSEPTTKGTVVMLHGYTAGPWQYNSPAEDFFEAGYNVYVPRITGHGYMTPEGHPSNEKMISKDNIQDYDKFVDEVYDMVKDLGGPVQIVGLSGGGNLALRMAERHPDIKGMVVMAPYLGPNTAVKPLSRALQVLDRFSPIKPHAVMDLFNVGDNSPTGSAIDMPHTRGTMDNATAMLYVGANVEKINVPTQFVTTEGDALSGTGPVGNLFEKSGGKTQNGWFHFREEDKVPHAMASDMQNTEPGRHEQLWQMAFNMLEKGQTTSRLPGS